MVAFVLTLGVAARVWSRKRQQQEATAMIGQVFEQFFNRVAVLEVEPTGSGPHLAVPIAHTAELNKDAFLPAGIMLPTSTSVQFNGTDGQTALEVTLYCGERKRLERAHALGRVRVQSKRPLDFMTEAKGIVITYAIDTHGEIRVTATDELDGSALRVESNLGRVDVVPADPSS